MNKNAFDKTKRESVTTKDLNKALHQILTISVPQTKSENREPTKVELKQKWKIVKR